MTADGSTPPTSEGVSERQRFLDLLTATGAVGEGTSLSGPLHFGQAASEHSAVRESCGVLWRPDQGLMRVHGRAPVQMLDGIVTCAVPAPPSADSSGRLSGIPSYGAVLTPKGRMISDFRMMWLGGSEEDGLGLAVPSTGWEGLESHFRRFLPPRFASIDDKRATIGLVTVVGPDALDVIRSVFAMPDPPGYSLEAGGPLAGGMLILQGLEQPASWDLWGSYERLDEAWRTLTGAGVKAVGSEAWQALRVEQGFPEFGVDMDESTIPIEAGLVDRAFDHEKGCYTGQEVIVRIRHRGHVNWHLRALDFGDDVLVSGRPAPGAELFEAEGTKVLGRVTSAVVRPGRDRVVGLGYVRREVELPGQLHLGSGRGTPVGVRVLPYGMPADATT